MEQITQINEPKIYEYNNYRIFLKDTYSYLKQNKTSFSFRYFSRISGFQSPNFLKLVMDGRRNLSKPSTEKVAQALKLKKDESEFFKNLVQFTQSDDSDEKAAWAQKLFQSKAFHQIYPLKQAEFNYYTQWYFVAIREMASHKNFSEDTHWIANQICPPVKPEEAERALDELEKLGLLKRDGGGRLVQAESIVSTSNEVTATVVAQYHKEMLKKAAESIDRFPRHQRDISSATVSLSNKNRDKIKSLIQSFRNELLALADQDKDADCVYQINFQLFPLTVPTKAEGE